MDIAGNKIEFIGHSGFLISLKSGMKIAIDPYNLSSLIPKADIILITHSHYDHCSIKDIQKITKKGTIIVVSADSQSKITKIENVEMQVVEVGDELAYKELKIEAVPAYNIGKQYHEKKEGWLGYVLKYEDLVIYHAGDTDIIPEMKKLTGYGKHNNIFITLLPVSGTYVMDTEEAVEAAKILSPTIAIPMHFGSGVVGTEEDAKKFVQLCEKKGIKAQILEKI